MITKIRICTMQNAVFSVEKQKISLTKEIIRQINLQCDLRCFHEIFDKETIVKVKWNFTPFQEIKLQYT